jgi:hypothetical protein
MASLKVSVKTRSDISASFDFSGFPQAQSKQQDGFSAKLSEKFPHRITITPPAGEKIASIDYSISTPLKNYHQVIVPDTGRNYPSDLQLVTFWGRKWQSRVNNVRMPVFFLTGPDLKTALAFGVIGENIETDFDVREPGKSRALIAWMKRLTLGIRRGTDDYPIPDSLASANDDGAITEYIYFKADDQLGDETWIQSLRDFSETMRELCRLDKPRTTDDSLLPWWCSWTDWHSDNVTEEVILDNVRQGLELGIKNFIIDDGWFGPGLDSDFGIKLNIGDWSEDPCKIKDLKALVEKIQAAGAKAVIWCAPHAVAPDSKVYPNLKKYLIQTIAGEDMMTPNKFHSLCFMCPEARKAMADVCVDLIERYGVDGAKYDLFNCVPGEPCLSGEHEHDTTSAVEGLAKLLEEIDARTRALKSDYITELKQNYATPYLDKYGTVVRAGDTPYNPEGNFLRTAYINAYTPYSLNDYQTITNNDTIAGAACMIIKMMAVGIPTYSIDLPALSEEHRRNIKFYHDWYSRNLPALRGSRIPLDGQLGSWLARGENSDIYFLVNGESRLDVRRAVDCEILNGTFCERLHLHFPSRVSVTVTTDGFDGADKSARSYTDVEDIVISSQPGDIIRLKGLSDFK